MTPTIWLAGGLGLLGLIFIGGTAIKHASDVKGARNEGIAIGTGRAATSTVEAVAKTAEAERAATEETPLVIENAELVALCKRSASCKERHQFK